VDPHRPGRPRGDNSQGSTAIDVKERRRDQAEHRKLALRGRRVSDGEVALLVDRRHAAAGVPA
jgi:hypothetical protein